MPDRPVRLDRKWRGFMKIETLFVHAGHHIDETTGAVAPPIHLSTTFARDAGNALIGPSQYIREGNPTQALLEQALARVEGGQAALAFASGMAAGVAVLQQQAGDAGANGSEPNNGNFDSIHRQKPSSRRSIAMERASQMGP